MLPGTEHCSGFCRSQACSGTGYVVLPASTSSGWSVQATKQQEVVTDSQARMSSHR